MSIEAYEELVGRIELYHVEKMSVQEKVEYINSCAHKVLKEQQQLNRDAVP
jgi:hypothetical protein